VLPSDWRWCWRPWVRADATTSCDQPRPAADGKEIDVPLFWYATGTRSGPEARATTADVVHFSGSAPSQGRTAVKTARERAEQKRQEKLEHVREQLESGSLVVRKMTEEERQRYPINPRRRQRSQQ
jgi:hypothetical protein